MNVIMIYDQIQSGLGTTDDKMTPLGGKKEAIGPGVMMAPFLKKYDMNVMATLYCGHGTYREDPEMVTDKLTKMVEKLSPDMVICGPAYNFKDYALMAAHTADKISKNTKIKAIAAMSKENDETIKEYKQNILIVKTPAKGEGGLNRALENICQVASDYHQGTLSEVTKNQTCY